MKLRLRQLYYRVTSSLWFIPSVFAAVSIVLAILAVDIDERMSAEQVKDLPFIFKGGAEGARSVLSTIAGAIITVAGVIFSVTMVALTLASQQFGPRLLRNFMGDRTNQVTIGAFIATFLFCLVVMGTVTGQEEFSFVPNIAVTFALALTIMCLGLIIVYIHHTASSLNVSRAIEVVWRQLLDAIDHLFPDRLGHDASPEEVEVKAPSGTYLLVHSTRAGYVQAVDSERLLGQAAGLGVIVELCVRPGDFVVEQAELARVWGARDPGQVKGIGQSITIGGSRTPLQDVEFMFDQLTEIALRALSPGVNDPFTAFTCIDYISGGLARLAGRQDPKPLRKSGDGELRVIVESDSFAKVLDGPLSHLRLATAGMPLVIERLLLSLRPVCEHVTSPSRTDALRRHVMAIAANAEIFKETADRQRIRLALLSLGECMDIPANLLEA